MNLKEFDSFRLSDAISFHDNLNTAIFDGDTMNPEVRQQLLTIAHDFIDHLGIHNIDVEDITLSGSNAAYSYTRHSDIDLHILVDMDKFNNDDVYRELFNAKKIIYNDTHNIKISGYDVELYVQDNNLPVISLGEYSILNDKWLRLPRKRKADVDQAATKLKFNKLIKLAEFALKSNNPDKITHVLTTIKKYRQAGLDLNGEYGPENIAFKVLRAKKIIGKLYDRLDQLHSERLSLPEDDESLSKETPTIDQLVRKFNVSRGYIWSQLYQGIKVELEHTDNEDQAREIALDHLNERPDYYAKLTKAGLEECSGYIPSEHEKNDKRFKTALSVDVGPQTMKQSAKKFGWKIARNGVPPSLR